MSVNEDTVLAGSDSFWEIGKYMRTVKRCDNGYQLCSHLKKLLEERSEIEKKYAATLQEWSKKWNAFLDKEVEYGTTKAAWRSVLTEAEEVANLHIRIAEKLTSEVYASIKVWQKDNYHKSMMHFKETKEFEENFRKAQKPWAKRLTKLLAARKDYHAACRAEKSTANQENNARGDPAVSPDQLKKLQDKLRKCQQEVDSTKDKYSAALNDINSYNAKYIEDMTEVYQKCQEFEQKRIEFFKKTFFQIHQCLDLSVDAKFNQIYASLNNTIANVDYNKDLKWWSTIHGVDMAMSWPEFEEYSPELQAISKRSKSNLNSADGGVVITGIKHSRDDSFGSGGNEPGMAQHRQSSASNMQTSTISYGGTSTGGVNSNSKSGESLNPFGDDDDEEDDESLNQVLDEKDSDTENDNADICKPQNQSAPTVSPRNVQKPGNRSESPVNVGENPFGEPDDDEREEGDGESVPSQGWTVRALYDYVKAEDDELEFKAGDIFIQIATEDDMGWCKGKFQGKIGYYPKNYVERI